MHGLQVAPLQLAVSATVLRVGSESIAPSRINSRPLRYHSLLNVTVSAPSAGGPLQLPLLTLVHSDSCQDTEVCAIQELEFVPLAAFQAETSTAHNTGSNVDPFTGLYVSSHDYATMYAGFRAAGMTMYGMMYGTGYGQRTFSYMLAAQQAYHYVISTPANISNRMTPQSSNPMAPSMALRAPTAAKPAWCAPGVLKASGGRTCTFLAAVRMLPDSMDLSARVVDASGLYGDMQVQLQVGNTAWPLIHLVCISHI